jgi:hypothetical protein
MSSARTCEHCGASYVPRREHARFCSARCRVAWNREHAGDASAGENALDWALSAMSEAIARFDEIANWELAGVVAAVGEAVWWVTLVDATLVRYHAVSYDVVLDHRSAASRERIGDSLAGLRFVRNQMGRHRDLADFVRGERGRGWTWRDLPEPVDGPASPDGNEWELSRYQAYRDRLAGQDITEAFTLTAAFLTKTAQAAGRVGAAREDIAHEGEISASMNN